MRERDWLPVRILAEWTKRFTAKAVTSPLPSQVSSPLGSKVAPMFSGLYQMGPQEGAWVKG